MNNEIESLIGLFSTLPTIGKKTATRIVLDLIAKNKDSIPKFVQSLNDTYQVIKSCEICNNIDSTSPCHICTSEKKDKNIICVVENIEDLWVIEKGNMFNGQYHILGGTLSAVKGVGPDDLNISSLTKRLNKNLEIILALSSSLDGQTTSLFLSDMLSDKVMKITKLGYGIPLGSEIGYLDEGTINAAFEARKIL
ncbi:MAG: recombination protein RecR [Alphaproteobacteria bacterium]|jgi:recombination protein RecR|nr:recombination protein RecR [Alphaproteobacteria bacterium]MBT5828464.1 recombination protein RecR [Alphaproteobacteria bacterium]